MSQSQPARTTAVLPVSVSPLGEDAAADPEVLDMLIEGSLDPEVRAKNYLPAYMDAARAAQYCRESVGVVLLLGGQPVGVAVARPNPDPGQGVTVPPGCPELDMWVLPRCRGQAVRWLQFILDYLAQRFEQILGVTWEENHTAVALLRWSGWRWLGRSFWSDGSCAGYCQVFVYDLKAHRSSRK